MTPGSLSAGDMYHQACTCSMITCRSALQSHLEGPCPAMQQAHRGCVQLPCRPGACSNRKMGGILCMVPGACIRWIWQSTFMIAAGLPKTLGRVGREARAAKGLWHRARKQCE